MKGFRVGYILSVSFLLIMAMVFLTAGFFPAPKGPKAPEYPTAQNTLTQSFTTAVTGRLVAPQDVTELPITPPSDTTTIVAVTPYPTLPPLNNYNDKYDQYSKDQEQYKKDQAVFLQDKIVPYVRNVYVVWVITLVVLQIAGIVFAKKGMELSGGALSFTGIWGVVFGPFWGIMFFASSAVAAFGSSSTSTLSTEPITQTLGITCLIGGLISLIAGIVYDNGFYFLKKKGAGTF